MRSVGFNYEGATAVVSARPSEPEQPIDLKDQATVAKLRKTIGDQRIHVPVLGKDHEDFASGTVLPTEPEIRAERVSTGAVL